MLFMLRPGPSPQYLSLAECGMGEVLAGHQRAPHFRCWFGMKAATCLNPKLRSSEVEFGRRPNQ